MKKKLTLRNKRAITGYLFIMPFILGFIFLFLMPLVKSIQFSFNELRMSDKGYELIPVGLEYYKKALTIDPEFNRLLVESTLGTMMTVPIVIMFSFFAASLLNQSFRGRTIARAMFFLPVIVSTSAITGDFLMQAVSGTTGNQAQFTDATRYIIMLLMKTNLSPQFVMYIATAVENIYQVINASGIQIIIFLAGLQSIPASVYEAASMEGATAWESFWKITFPMISSLILVNTIYSIVDTFTKNNNAVISKISNELTQNIDYGYSSAMSWLYCIAILILLGVVSAIISKRVFYYE